MTFSWDVTGTGSIIHTAVHWDTKPGNPTDFNSYGHFTLEFADISPADQAPKTYTVSFNAPTAAGTIYYVIHAIVGDQHIYISGGERTIVIQATATTATSTTATTPSTTAPTAAAPGVNPLLVGGVAAIVVIAVAAAIILRRR